MFGAHCHPLSIGHVRWTRDSGGMKTLQLGLGRYMCGTDKELMDVTYEAFGLQGDSAMCHSLEPPIGTAA